MMTSCKWISCCSCCALLVLMTLTMTLTSAQSSSSTTSKATTHTVAEAGTTMLDTSDDTEGSGITSADITTNKMTNTTGTSTKATSSNMADKTTGSNMMGKTTRSSARGTTASSIDDETGSGMGDQSGSGDISPTESGALEETTETALLQNTVTDKTVLQTTTIKDISTTQPQTNWANQETRLLDKLFNMPGYYSDARPVRDSSTALAVDIQFAIMFILDLEEKAQILTTYSWIIMNWYDELRVWNMSEYAGLETVTVPASQIWVPDIGMSNSADQLYGDILDPSKFKAVINASGYVTYRTSGTTVTSCLLNVTFFPFDVQACYIQLDSWAIPNDQLDMRMAKTVDRDNYRRNSQWDLYDTNVKDGEIRGYDYVQAIFYLRRKPTYYLITLILPCVIITVLSVLVFLMPNEAGEKISLQVTILLSFSVFQFAISDNMPKTSDHTPIINVYVLAGMMLSALSLVVTVLIQRFHFVTSRPVPHWLSFFMFDVLDRIFGVRTKAQVEEDYENRRIKAQEEARKKILDSRYGQQQEEPSRFGRIFSMFGGHSPAFRPSVGGVANPMDVTSDEKDAMALANPEINVESMDPEGEVGSFHRQGSRRSMVSGEGSMLRSRGSVVSRRPSQAALVNPVDAQLAQDAGFNQQFMEEFRQVGRICDRLFFFIFTFSILFITIGMFIIFGVNKDKRVEPIAFS